MLLVAVGYFLGQRSSWGTKHPDVKAGIAMRANGENGLIIFDAEDGTQADMWAGDIRWESESAGGDSDPECLPPLKRAEVEVGVMKIATPDGGWFTKAVRLRSI